MGKVKGGACERQNQWWESRKESFALSRSAFPAIYRMMSLIILSTHLGVMEHSPSSPQLMSSKEESQDYVAKAENFERHLAAVASAAAAAAAVAAAANSASASTQGIQAKSNSSFLIGNLQLSFWKKNHKKIKKKNYVRPFIMKPKLIFFSYIYRGHFTSEVGRSQQGRLNWRTIDRT